MTKRELKLGAFYFITDIMLPPGGIRRPIPAQTRSGCTSIWQKLRNVLALTPSFSPTALR
jgi:hypothetical protein